MKAMLRMSDHTGCIAYFLIYNSLTDAQEALQRITAGCLLNKEQGYYRFLVQGWHSEGIVFQEVHFINHYYSWDARLILELSRNVCHSCDLKSPGIYPFDFDKLVMEVPFGTAVRLVLRKLGFYLASFNRNKKNIAEVLERI